MSSTIDWSKAPEGATHFVCGSICPWEKRVGALWYYWSHKNDWVLLGSSDCRGDARILTSELSIIARPTESPAWNGEGLPPVGTVCECQNDNFDWLQGTVVHVGVDRGSKLAIMQCEHEVLWGEAGEFRPIRTPEQTAAEARAIEILEIERIAVTGENSGQHYAAAIYDAGYRKVEQS